jgi:hypothetical protein
MPEPPINQTGNVVGGDLAGRDILKISLHSSVPSPLRLLAEQFRMECAEDARLSTFIERLQHFLVEAPSAPARDLSTKLEDADRSDQIAEGLRLKEQFTKKLTKLQFSPQAQEIFAHVLSKIYTFFVYKIRPRLMEGATRAQIDDLTYTELLVPLYEEVGNCKFIDLTDLQGMTYFLAGNCHISWD